MAKNKLRKNKLYLSLLFAILVMAIMLTTMLITYACSFLIQYTGLFYAEANKVPLFLYSVVCLVLGFILSLVFSRIPLKPIRQVIEAADKLASGDFSARIELKGAGEIEQLNKSFNHMAEELGSVEMLQSDFVNNFSHEFKTPIVSIRGFAKMLKRDDLTDEERAEYLDIIISESERLTELSTNVLNLTKVEQQTILTDKKKFNVSEQIRLVISMLDSKWKDKQVSVSLDAPELFIVGNENMLQQVWLNLLDNAIKFSTKREQVDITASRHGNNCVFTFTNYGIPVSDEDISHIFDKFYQGDKSHAEKGNGLGLAIADRIVKLHGGTVELERSDEKKTTFVVSIPADNTATV